MKISSLLLGAGATFYGLMMLFAAATRSPLYTLPLWMRGVGLVAIGAAFLWDWWRGRKC